MHLHLHHLYYHTRASQHRLSAARPERSVQQSRSHSLAVNQHLSTTTLTAWHQPSPLFFGQHLLLCNVNLNSPLSTLMPFSPHLSSDIIWVPSSNKSTNVNGECSVASLTFATPPLPLPCSHLSRYVFVSTTFQSSPVHRRNQIIFIPFPVMFLTALVDGRQWQRSCRLRSSDGPHRSNQGNVKYVLLRGRRGWCLCYVLFVCVLRAAAAW